MGAAKLPLHIGERGGGLALGGLVHQGGGLRAADGGAGGFQGGLGAAQGVVCAIEVGAGDIVGGSEGREAGLGFAGIGGG